MVQIRLDRGSHTPAYLQVVAQVREAVRMGWLLPGDQLPGVREVAVTSGINPNTVQKAYHELAVLGLTETRPGSGTYIRASLGVTDPHLMVRFRAQLERWRKAALAAGLEAEDLQTLVTSVLTDGDSAVAARRVTALVVTQVGKQFGRSWAVRDVSFSLERGRVAAVVGSNGAGKTTLLNLIAGAKEPTEGFVATGVVRFVAQSKPVYGYLTAADMLEFGRRMNPRWEQPLAQRWLETFDVPSQASLRQAVGWPAHPSCARCSPRRPP